MVLPVAGLRAVRAGRSAFSNEPNPVIATLSPLATAVWIVSRMASTASAAAVLLPSRSEMASTSSRLFMGYSSSSPLARTKLREPQRGHNHLHARDGVSLAFVPHWPPAGPVGRPISGHLPR